MSQKLNTVLIMVAIFVLLFLNASAWGQKTFYKVDLRNPALSEQKEMYYFNKTRVRDADLKGVKTKIFYTNTGVWQKGDFRNADLKGSSWIRTTCWHCDFRGTDLRDSIFFDSDFRFSIIDSATQFSISKKRIEQLGFRYVD